MLKSCLIFGDDIDVGSSLVEERPSIPEATEAARKGSLVASGFRGLSDGSERGAWRADIVLSATY